MLGRSQGRRENRHENRLLPQQTGRRDTRRLASSSETRDQLPVAVGKVTREFPQVRRQRILQAKCLSGERVPELQKTGVEKEPRQTVCLAKERVDLSLSVSRVAKDLMGEVGEVTPNLMAPAGENTRSKKRTAGELGQLHELGDGGLRYGVSRLRSPPPASASLGEWAFGAEALRR